MSKKIKAVATKDQAFEDISDDELREELMEKESVEMEDPISEKEKADDQPEDEQMELEEPKETTAYEKFIKDNSNKMDLSLINNKIQDLVGNSNSKNKKKSSF